jgi:hypothetical protein
MIERRKHRNAADILTNFHLAIALDEFQQLLDLQVVKRKDLAELVNGHLNFRFIHS